jgi:arsenate reductase
MSVTIYHNPSCSKSRATLALLQERGITPTVVEYLKIPPDAATLKGVLAMLKMTPRALLRKNEDPYYQLNLADPSLSDAALIDAMVKNPCLIERPIVVTNGKAAVGRPPENILTIL